MKNMISILIVDDDTELAKNFKDILEIKGYSAGIASSGKEALNLLKNYIYDLALVDMKLPDVSGLDLIEEITKTSPILEYIIITGYASLESAVKAVKEKKIIAYETKPVNIENVLSLIKEVDKAFSPK